MNERKNPYPGVNAHLNMFLQQPDGGWESFHASMMTYLLITLDEVLPDGYYSISEKSLQVARFNFDPFEDRPVQTRTRPDVGVYRDELSVSSAPTMLLEQDVPTAVFPLIGLDVELDQMMSVTIYDMRNKEYPGILVTRIELLSPANKPPGRDFAVYQQRRLETLASGVALVEIDLLQKQRPIYDLVPDYSAKETDAYPYYSLVWTPDQKNVKYYGFGVLDAFRPILLPLGQNEAQEHSNILYNIGQAYQRLFEEVRIFSLLPKRMSLDRVLKGYNPDDQAALRAFWAARETNDPSA